MPVPLTPIRFLARTEDLYANRTGVVCGDKAFTYAEFGNRARRLAAALKINGIHPGDRVAFLSLNNHMLLEAYYGVPMAHAILMPLNVRLSQPELAQILAHAEARILFYEPDFAPLVEHLKTHVERAIPLDHTGYEALLASVQAPPPPIDYASIDDTDTAELFYTSGSTGTPKGVMLSHRALYLHALSVATLYRNADTLVDMHTIPLFHANGWGHAHTNVLFGIPQIMCRRFDPPAVLALIQKHRVTDCGLVPTMANALLNCPDLASYDTSSLREIQIGGAAASPDLIRRMHLAFPTCNTWAGYGLSETAPVLTCARAESTHKFPSEDDRWKTLAMTGRPIAGVDLQVVDYDSNPVPRDNHSIGEIIVRCDFLMTGYYKDPEGTAAVIKNDWFHTGDMAIWRPDGYVQIVDRRKEIIVSGGENISSIEVERAIVAHPDVYECAVVSAPDDKWGEVPAAIVVLKPGSKLTKEMLCAFLEKSLGKFKMPRIIEFESEQLPKTGTGKIRKMQLRERYWAGRQRRVGE